MVKNIAGGQKLYNKTYPYLTKGKIYVCLKVEHFRPVKNIAGQKMFWASIHKNLEEDKKGVGGHIHNFKFWLDCEI